MPWQSYEEGLETDGGKESRRLEKRRDDVLGKRREIDIYTERKMRSSIKLHSKQSELDDLGTVPWGSIHLRKRQARQSVVSVGSSRPK